MLTEEEAKGKWCPKSGAPAGHSQGRCIGSQCMAWRFESEESFQARCEAWEDAANIGGITDRGSQPVVLGFCGLAGRPE